MSKAKRNRQASRRAAFVAMTGPVETQVSPSMLETWAFDLGKKAHIDGGDPDRDVLMLDGREVAWSAKSAEATS